MKFSVILQEYIKMYMVLLEVDHSHNAVVGSLRAEQSPVKVPLACWP